MSDRRSTVPVPGATGTSGWVGWVAFAGLMLALLASFQLTQGVVALVKDEYFLVARSELSVQLGYTAWGWVHVVSAAVLYAAAIGVFAGRVWARVVGVLVALVSAIVNMAFIAAYPLWSVMMIGLAVVVILALALHGSEIRARG
jgi:hypothetical protein